MIDDLLFANDLIQCIGTPQYLVSSLVNVSSALQHKSQAEANTERDQD